MKKAIKIVKKIGVNTLKNAYPYRNINEWIAQRGPAKDMDSHVAIGHVGAHFGQEADAYEKLRIDEVIWVEAHPATFEQLQQKLQSRPSSSTVHRAFNCLLTSTSNQDYDFHVFSNHGASNSIFKSTDILKESWPGIKETGEVIKLKSQTLDELLSDNQINLDFLLIDVQGAELEVLKGATATLHKVAAVEIEISQAQYYQGGCLFRDVDSFLISHGFFRESFVPWHGNVLYVKKPTTLERTRVYFADFLVATFWRLKRLFSKKNRLLLEANLKN